MLNGFRILLLIVFLLGFVLIYGYTQLTFNADEEPKEYRSRSFLQVPIQETTESVKFKNLTGDAANQNLVIFNRVPKTGSEMFQSFGQLLSSIWGYHSYIDPQSIDLFPNRIKLKSRAKKLSKLESGVYYRHMTYLNMSDYGSAQPIYISVVRHPIDRVVSWYYYQRWKDRPDDKTPAELCDKNSDWRNLCDSYQLSRQQDYTQSEEWFNMTFDECAEKKLAECTFSPGSGYLLEKNFKFDARSQMMFFCGNTPQCALFNSKKVLNRAKETVETAYSVVGILEELDSTFLALQKYLPKFFRNAKELYDENLHNLTLTHTNKNPYKKALKAETRALLEARFQVEIEFYEFCRQRLHKQLQAAAVLHQDKSNDAVKWPDQIARDEIVPMDDYILL